MSAGATTAHATMRVQRKKKASVFNHETRTWSNENAGKAKLLSSLGRLVFWIIYLLIQGFLFQIYHDAALTSSSSSENKSIQQYGFENPLQGLQKLAEDFTKGSTQQRKRNENGASAKRKPPPDGTFNGYPIYKLDNNNNNNAKGGEPSLEELYSQFHCVGETWHEPDWHRRSRTHHEQSWMYRSCRFQVLCYDTSTQDYVVYLDPEKHKSSHDHYVDYHDDPTNQTKFHPSQQIQKIIHQQKEWLAKEREEIADPKHERNSTTKYKHVTNFDDTSTIYRNHTAVVNGNGQAPLADVDRGKHYGVSIGSVNGKWGLVDIQLLKWFPEVRWGAVPGSSSSSSIHNGEENYEVYTLPSSVVMIPFHSLSAENPGHLVWDDFLPMYTLLHMFGFLKPPRDNDGDNDSDDDWADLLPIRHQLPNMERGLWAGCDWTNAKTASCNKMLGKFGTLMGTRRSYLKHRGGEFTDTNPDEKKANNSRSDDKNSTEMKSASKLPRIPITTNNEVQLFTTKDSDESTPKLICSKNAMAGFGAISDHLPNFGHGWSRHDYKISYNSGRGGQLFEFRNFMVQNLFGSLPKTSEAQMPAPSEQRRRLGVNNPQIDAAQSKQSVNLGAEELATFPPFSVTDRGPDEPLVVLFSAYSSQRRGGSMKVETRALLEKIEEAGGAFPFLYGREASPGDIGANVEIVVEIHVFSRYTLEAQIQMASRSAAFVTYCGGGAITASFLPKGGALHLYYGEDGGIENNVPTHLPARLDWDFFNNCGYLHVKWIPYYISHSKWEKGYVDGGGYKNQAEANAYLLRDDLRRIHRERVEHYNQAAAAKP